MSAAQSLAKSVRDQPKETALAMVEKTGVCDKTAMDLVKFMRNPNMINGPRKREYSRARDQFSKAGDAGVEWAFRYAEHKVNESGPFARRERPDSAEVDKLAGSTDTAEKGVWGDSPFTV